MGIEPDDVRVKRVSVLSVIRFVGEGSYLGRCIWFWITTLYPPQKDLGGRVR